VDVNSPIHTIGFVHNHNGAVIFDGDRRQSSPLARRRNHDLGRLDETGAHTLIGGQINPIRPRRVLLANQDKDMGTGIIGCDRGNVAEEIVDAGEPIVRRLGASTALVRPKAGLSRYAAVNDDPPYGTIAVEILSQAAISGAIEVIGDVIYAAADIGTDAKDAIDIAHAVRRDTLSGNYGTSVRPIVVDRIIYGKRGAIVSGHSHPLIAPRLEIVVGDKNVRPFQSNPWLVRRSSSEPIYRRPGTRIGPCCQRGGVCSSALVDVAIRAEYRTVQRTSAVIGERPVA
jgi:hypothetical protein